MKSAARKVLSKMLGRKPAAPPPGFVDQNAQWEPPNGLFSPANPMLLRIDEACTESPMLNVLIPGMCMRAMSGGPNTIINLAYRMAAHGVPVRFISADVPPDPDLGPVWDHMMKLANVPERLPHVQIVDGSDRSGDTRLAIGAQDTFMISAWWNAQMVKYALRLTKPQRFIYMIQDFEPGLHEFSTCYALALETYGMDYVPIVNHPFLGEFFRTRKIGSFADPEFAERAIVLDAAIDRSKFYFERERPAADRRKLLFYARPTTGKRNLYELGIGALQLAAQRGAFEGYDWEILGMGDAIEPVPLAGGNRLVATEWRDFDGYARQMRSADVLLSLMLSPHPSYPPLEMAACGGLVVTNSHENKTAERFSAISNNIITARATVESIADAIVEATRRSADFESRERHSHIAAPESWDAAFAAVIPYALEAYESCRSSA